jgi:hypothetical protein
MSGRDFHRSLQRLSARSGSYEGAVLFGPSLPDQFHTQSRKAAKAQEKAEDKSLVEQITQSKLFLSSFSLLRLCGLATLRE